MKPAKPPTSLDSFVSLAALFEGPLASASFPGVDAGTIPSLVQEAERRAAQLTAARLALASAQSDLAAAELAYAEHHAHLAEKSQLALAYARVYAGPDRALVDALEKIELPRARGRATRGPVPNDASASDADADASPAPRRRGRPPKPIDALVESEIAAE